MLEEPMYLIFNVAISSSWGSRPIFDKTVCRGDGTDPDKAKIAKAKKICDAYPMYLKVDYIRLYQDLGPDLEADNYMSVGCDPASHPTKEWIEGNIKEYTDDDNPMIEVTGGAACSTDDDCSVRLTDDLSHVSLTTGKCVSQRCVCSYPTSWGGPRCTVSLSSTESSSSKKTIKGFGPPIEVPLIMAGLVMVLTSISVCVGMREKNTVVSKPATGGVYDRKKGPAREPSGRDSAIVATSNYSANFV